MTQEIKLPPVPASDVCAVGYRIGDMRAYARAAIELDRQQRGELVAWRATCPNRAPLFFPDGREARLLCGTSEWTIAPVFTAPQPAEPMKVPTYADAINMAEEIAGSQAVAAFGWDNTVELVRVTLERYGQGEQPAAPTPPAGEQAHPAPAMAGDEWTKEAHRLATDLSVYGIGSKGRAEARTAFSAHRRKRVQLAIGEDAK